MVNTGDIKYRMKCTVCGRSFLADDASSKVPKHPQKGQTEKPGISYVPCGGSGAGGIVAGTATKRFDDI